jgi:molybdopterin converting factor small subunit
MLPTNGVRQLDLRYIAHVTMVTGTLEENYQTDASTIRELLDRLDARYSGFRALFVNPETGQMNLNAMIYYSDVGEVPVSVIDLDHAINDGGTVTFW